MSSNIRSGCGALHDVYFNMELELEGGSAIGFLVVIAIIGLLLFGLVGRFVTPVDAAGEPQWLTPAQWPGYKPQTETHGETERLVEDARRIQRILESETPDPVQAMLVAQEIYANYQTGSSATAAARIALIAAAEATVKATVGEIPRDEAITSYQRAKERIHALSTVTHSDDDAPPAPTPTPSPKVFAPLYFNP
jgi:hypothetical protein